MATTNPLGQLSDQGVAVWVDSIARDWLEKGELRRLRDEFSVVGVTSNPTIFQAAIGAGGFYDDQLTALAQQGLPTPAIFERLALYDIRWAAHELHTVYQASDGLNGCVSYEVPPDLAHDTDETIFQAARLFDLLSLPNVMIKIPATVEGLPAIRASIAAGINVNVTLVFSVARSGSKRAVPTPSWQRPGWGPPPSTTPSSPTRPGSSCSPGHAGRPWPPRAPDPSAACGPPPPPRIPTTATCCIPKS